MKSRANKKICNSTWQLRRNENVFHWSWQSNLNYLLNISVINSMNNAFDTYFRYKEFLCRLLPTSFSISFVSLIEIWKSFQLNASMNEFKMSEWMDVLWNKWKELKCSTIRNGEWMEAESLWVWKKEKLHFPHVNLILCCAWTEKKALSHLNFALFKPRASLISHRHSLQVHFKCTRKAIVFYHHFIAHIPRALCITQFLPSLKRQKQKVWREREREKII